MLRAKDAVRVRVADELLRVLVRIPIDENGFLMNEQDAWKIGQRNEAGEGIEGIAIFNFVRATNSIQRMKP